MPAISVRILSRITCPHCWTSVRPEEILWVSAHSDLLGDPRLGPEQQQRFLPTRFNVDGQAIDSRGFVCNALACPRCHLVVPRALLEMEPFFVSILGTPACGKSYYLAALTWELRRILPLHFAVSFTDADPVLNRSLSENEESLFLNPKSDDLVPLANLIRKTELQGELYDTVMYGNQAVSYPRPFPFALQPLEKHPNRPELTLARVLCLYDNAGEHFHVGQDSTSNPVTQHLAQSRLLLFLFDPTQDQRFRKLCRDAKSATTDVTSGRTSRQESVLLEAAARVRRYAGLPQNAKHNRPLVVVVTKYDVWSAVSEDEGTHEPWLADDGLFALDLKRIEKRSQSLRALMLNVCPEVVNAAESFAKTVVYVPVSALGRTPVTDESNGRLAIHPREIKPSWVTIPLLYGLCRWMPGLISGIKDKRKPGSPAGHPQTSTPMAGERR
jgi:hypothetical protein